MDQGSCDLDGLARWLLSESGQERSRPVCPWTLADKLGAEVELIDSGGAPVKVTRRGEQITIEVERDLDPLLERFAVACGAAIVALDPLTAPPVLVYTFGGDDPYTALALRLLLPSEALTAMAPCSLAAMAQQLEVPVWVARARLLEILAGRPAIDKNVLTWSAR
jgi:hypothetical protein